MTNAAVDCAIQTRGITTINESMMAFTHVRESFARYALVIDAGLAALPKHHKTCHPMMVPQPTSPPPVAVKNSGFVAAYFVIVSNPTLEIKTGANTIPMETAIKHDIMVSVTVTVLAPPQTAIIENTATISGSMILYGIPSTVSVITALPIS